MRVVGEWLQEIAHLNILVHAQKIAIESATSLQLGHNFCSGLLQAFWQL
jgi:hypothetical protein